MWKAGLSSKQDAWTLARDLEERPGSARARGTKSGEGPFGCEMDKG